MSALSGISGWGIAWLALGIGSAITVTAIGLAAIGIAIGELLTRLARGQGGAPPLPRTGQLPLGDLVVNPEQERYAAWKAAQLTQAQAPRCAWCWPADGDGVPSPDECPCRDDCGSVACIAPLRAEGFPS